MVVKIKLQRKGTKNKPFYRVVVQSATTARDGDVIEILGQYDPLQETALFNVDQEKTKEWLAKGAQPTEKARILLGKAGILPPVDLAALPKRKPKAEQLAPAEATAEDKKEEGKPADEKKEEAKDEDKDKEEKEEVKESASAPSESQGATADKEPEKK